MDQITSTSTALYSKSVSSTNEKSPKEDVSMTPVTIADPVKDRVKERLDQFKRDLKKQIPLGDYLDMRDPQCIAELAQEVYQSMIEKEKYY